MISIAWVFYLMVGFFALIGSIRGWQREVIAMAGLIGSIAALNRFGYALVTYGSQILRLVQAGDPADVAGVERQAFWVQFIFHATIAFFSYQVIARLADNAPSNRIGDRLRMGFQKRFIGSILGTINGYLLIGCFWGFLEYRLVQTGGYQRLQPGMQYVFGANITRPALAEGAFDLAGYLPFGLFSPAVWLILFFISFFVVIIALI